MSNEAKTWTVREVLERVPQLGIPHFQRGLVWGVESRAALLESLFFDTPCGSFVLWEPKDCEAGCAARYLRVYQDEVPGGRRSAEDP